MTRNSTAMAPPAMVWSLTEGSRSMSELAWFYGVRSWLTRRSVGDGRSVLVIPGLMADDASTAPLRSLLRSVGYRVYGWRLGVDIGPTARIVDGLDERLAYIRERNDGAVSVIGQSLGGLMGRELARRNPGAVDRLITLGSPMNLTDRAQSRAGRTYDFFAPHHLPEYSFENWMAMERPVIPSTSIYSRLDGIVATSACVYDKGTPLTENIRVHSSHLGMGVQPAAVYATLDRLGAPLDDWQPFRAPAHLRAYFPAT